MIRIRWNDLRVRKLTFHDDNSKIYFNVYFGQFLSLSMTSEIDRDDVKISFSFFSLSLPGTFGESLAIFVLIMKCWQLLLFPGKMINISMKPHKLDLGPYQFSCEPYNNCCIGMLNVKLLKNSEIFWNLLALAERGQKIRKISSCRETRVDYQMVIFANTVLSRVLCRVLHWN